MMIRDYSQFFVLVAALQLFATGCEVADKPEELDTSRVQLLAIGDDGETGLVGHFDPATGEVVLTSTLVHSALELATKDGLDGATLMFIPHDESTTAYEIAAGRLSVFSMVNLEPGDKGRLCIVTGNGLRWTVARFRVDVDTAISEEFVPSVLKRECFYIDEQGNTIEMPCNSFAPDSAEHVPAGTDGDPTGTSAWPWHSYVVASEWVWHTGAPGDHLHYQTLRCIFHSNEEFTQVYDLGNVYFYWDGGWTLIEGNDYQHTWHKGYRCDQNDGYDVDVHELQAHEWHWQDPNYCSKCTYRKWPNQN